MTVFIGTILHGIKVHLILHFLVVDRLQCSLFQVTIFGQSAGGVSVSHLMLSPYTQSMFHNAIAVSGGASALWGVRASTLG